VGDYLAGPSHVLPTGGTARFFSGLSVQDFMRHWAVIYYSRQALRELQEPLALLAECEGLDAHARSAQARFK
jgi:histidinol dehydrogenase